MTARPGSLAQVYEVDYPRPRSLEMMSDPSILKLVNQIRENIIGKK